MSNRTRLKEIDKQISELKQTDRNANIIALLVEAMSLADSNEERVQFLLELAAEYKNRGEGNKAEQLYKEVININPDHPANWMVLASHYHYSTKNLDEALTTINQAVRKAFKGNEYVRQSVGMRIRIALKMEMYDLVESSIKQLLDYNTPSGRIDINLERDFLSKIPPGTVNPGILNAYRQKCEAEQPHH